MKAALIAVGKLKKGPERELVQRYEQRLISSGRSVGLTGFDTVELPESRASQAEARKKDEATAILARLSAEDARIVFDERGKPLDSPAFATIIRRLLNNSRRPAFIIGGADGLDASVREGAEVVVSFGRLTIPHQIVRILAVEQIYRAVTILSGHPYHKI